MAEKEGAKEEEEEKKMQVSKKVYQEKLSKPKIYDKKRKIQIKSINHFGSLNEKLI